jgi:hypothetical protein
VTWAEHRISSLRHCGRSFGLHVLVALVGLAFALLAALAGTTGVTPSCATSAAA